MACNWNINWSHEPDMETATIECRCNDCGLIKPLHCDRDFVSGTLIVQVETCAAKRAAKQAQP